MNCCGSSLSPPSQTKSVLGGRLNGNLNQFELLLSFFLSLLASTSGDDDPLILDRGFNDEWNVIEKADDGFLSVQVHYLLNVESERRFVS